jgi:hypothetical protein
MEENNKKRSRDGRTINDKYDIVVYFEDLIKKNIKNAKTKTVDHFNLKQISTLNTILAKKDLIKITYLENQSTKK